jgi:hypothetical protein
MYMCNVYSLQLSCVIKYRCTVGVQAGEKKNKKFTLHCTASCAVALQLQLFSNCLSCSVFLTASVNIVVCLVFIISYLNCDR